MSVLLSSRREKLSHKYDLFQIKKTTLCFLYLLSLSYSSSTPSMLSLIKVTKDILLKIYNKDVRKKEGHISLEFSIRSGDVFYIICVM